MNYYNEIKNKLIDNEMYSKVKDYSKEVAKIEALENAPPENISNKAMIPPLVCSPKADKADGSIPGKTTNEPKRYIKTKKIVIKIRVLKSSIL